MLTPRKLDRKEVLKCGCLRYLYRSAQHDGLDCEFVYCQDHVKAVVLASSHGLNIGVVLECLITAPSVGHFKTICVECAPPKATTVPVRHLSHNDVMREILGLGMLLGALAIGAVFLVMFCSLFVVDDAPTPVRSDPPVIPADSFLPTYLHQARYSNTPHSAEPGP